MPSLTHMVLRDSNSPFMATSSFVTHRQGAAVSLRGRHARPLLPLQCQATGMVLPQIEEDERVKLWEKIEELEAELQIAVDDQNFKTAAELRDTIKELQGKDPYIVAEQRVSSAASQEK
jgi:hypothetical protein